MPDTRTKDSIKFLCASAKAKVEVAVRYLVCDEIAPRNRCIR